MIPNDDQDPELDDQNGSGNNGGGANDDDKGSGSGSNEPFLKVNDRTSFKTQEDAIKSYNEAGERIAQLSPWEDKVAKAYGLRGPDDVISLLEELRELRAEKQKGNGAANNQGNNQGANSGPDLSSLSPADRKAVEWLMKQGPTAGLITKKEYDDLKSQIAALSAGNQQGKDEIFNQRVERGQEYLGTLLTDDGLPTDPKFKLMVEKLITAYIDEDDNRVKAFYAGGEAHRRVIAEGYADAKATLELHATHVIAGQAAGKRNAGNGTNRSANGNTQTRPNNTNQRDDRQSNQNQRRQNNKPKEMTQDELDDAAWELFQARTNGEAE